jgi:hypothetical protein
MGRPRSVAAESRVKLGRKQGRKKGRKAEGESGYTHIIGTLDEKALFGGFRARDLARDLL